MRISRIYTSQALVDDTIDLEAQASHHLVRVLRAKRGHQVILFNGTGGECAGTIIEVGRDTARIHIDKIYSVARESSLDIHLIQAISRGDRMDYTIQKSVELGVSTIYPVSTERTEIPQSQDALERKWEHWRKIAVHACEQCGRDRLPRIMTPLPLLKLGDTLRELPLKLILDTHGTKGLRGITPTSTTFGVLCGPEGGFTPAELEWALALDFVPLRLGPRVLRTETAAVALLSALHALWGDFR